MPRGDRRGPNGMGSMTGRAAGLCRGAGAPGYMNGGVSGGYEMGAGRGAGRQQVGCSHMQPGFGGGFHRAGNGLGSGRGPGRGSAGGLGYQSPFAAHAYYRKTEEEFMESEVSFLKEQLKSLESRLADMQEDE